MIAFPVTSSVLAGPHGGGALIVRAAALGLALLNFHGTATAQGAAGQGAAAQQRPGPQVPAATCRLEPGAGCLCSQELDGRDISYPELQAEIAARFPDQQETPEAQQRRTEWRRQCAIISDEDTWP